MSGTLLKTIITLVLLFHGIGQLMGVLPLFHVFGTDTDSPAKWAKHWSSRSLLLNKLAGDQFSRIICFLLYSGAFLLFMATAMSLQGWILPVGLWKILAVIASIVSLVALMLFWNGLLLIFPHKVGNIAVNLSLLISIILIKWPPDALLGF